MPHITVTEAQGWLESTKLTLSELDSELETSVASQILGQLAAGFDVSTWASPTTTPTLVRKILAMYYASWVYDKSYSEDPDGAQYSLRLRARADALIAGILGGSIVLTDLTDPGQDQQLGQPAFYPTDVSDGMTPTNDDPSLGPAKFSMGFIF